MNETRTAIRTESLQDTGVNVKVILSSLWVAMLFVFAYVDIFAFWRADVINGALAGKVPVTGFMISQSFLVYTTLYAVIPSLMIVVSLLTPARSNRIANVIVSSLYIITIVVATVGESWAYYILGSVVEVLLLLLLAKTAWTWPRQPLNETR